MAEARGRGHSARGAGRGRGYALKRPMMDSYDGYTGGGATGGYAKKRKIMDDVYRFVVREDLVKTVIGKGGENIRIIKDLAKEQGIETKVSIYAQGANGALLMEGAIDRVMSVQTTIEGLAMALEYLVPAVQIFKNRNGQKLEIRLIVPSHCCSGIIGKGGSVIKKIKEETNSYIQVYTLPLPQSEEYCVRIQNFEAADLIKTAVLVFESIADIKGKNPIIMYDPIYFEHGEFGDTGSYVDTEWYQEALRSGVAQPTSFKTVRQIRGRGGRGSFAPQPSHYQYDEAYDSGYGDYGYGYEEAYYEGYEDPYYYDYSYDYSAPPMRPRGRGGPRGRAFGPRSQGSRGRPGRGFTRGGSRGRASASAGTEQIPPNTEAMEVTEAETKKTEENDEAV